MTLGKAMERSFSTFPHTHTFFFPNIYEISTTWEAKSIVAVTAAVAVADAVVEMNWEHKVTLDCGD